MGLVVPAVLPSSRKELWDCLTLLTRIPFIDRVQIDVVDGRFASPASWPYTSPDEFRDMVERGEMLPYLNRFKYEIDLMCFGADRVAENWLAVGATHIVFHSESATDLGKLLNSAKKQYGASGFTSIISFGLAINISSELSLIEPYLNEINYVQFMGISKIGRQGQPFDRRVLEKIRVFKTRHPKITMHVDGGVSLDNAKELVALGVSNLVIGSSILKSEDPTSVVARFEELQSPYGV